MRRIIITGLFAAVLAACAASAAPAMAHEFVASQTKGAVQDKNIGNHVFETGGATVECTEETSVGAVQAKHATVSKEAVLYGNCKFLGAAATVSQAKYEFKAEGTVAIENEITVKVPAVECEVKVGPTENQALKTITYNNNQQNGTIELKANVEGITAVNSGAGLLCPKGTNHTSKYKGASIIFFTECVPDQLGIYQDPQCVFQGKPGRYQEIPGRIYWV